MIQPLRASPLSAPIVENARASARPPAPGQSPPVGARESTAAVVHVERPLPGRRAEWETPGEARARSEAETRTPRASGPDQAPVQSPPPRDRKHSFVVSERVLEPYGQDAASEEGRVLQPYGVPPEPDAERLAEAPRREEPDAKVVDEERAKVEALERRDREVRAHEAAHVAASAGHAGTPRYEYEVGPDGKRYAVDGQVSVDVAPVRGDPEATVRKMEQIQRAALAAADPSAADRQIVAQAAQVAQRARAELAAEKYEASDVEAKAGGPGAARGEGARQEGAVEYRA